MKHTASSSYRPKTPNERRSPIPSELNLLGTNVLGEPERVPGHTRIEIIAPATENGLTPHRSRTKSFF
jgi:hypothetical protein